MQKGMNQFFVLGKYFIPLLYLVVPVPFSMSVGNKKFPTSHQVGNNSKF